MSELRWLQWFLPESLGQLEDKYTAELLVGGSFATAAWGFPFGLLMWYLGFQETAWVALVGILVAGLGPFVLHLSGSVEWTGHYIIAATMAIIVSIVWSLGGFLSPTMIFAAIPAFQTWLYIRGLGRAFWVLMSIASIWLLFFLGPQPADGFSASLFIYPFCYTAMIIIVLSTVWLFERRGNLAFARLEEANAELSSNRHELIKLTHDLSLARDEAIKANRSKSTFLANMSHELRTPLNAIIGYSELLLEESEGLDPAGVEDLERIQGAGQHLLSLISDILDISKIEAGRIDVHAESFGLEDFIQTLPPAILSLAKKNGNALEFDCPEDLGRINTDPTKLKQILVNLLSNACKFTHGGSVIMKVRRERRDEVDWLSFEVVDTGIGISPEMLEKIFAAFTQADALTTRKYGGTGLGLAISQRFARILGGAITATSVPEEGSTFVLSLPAEAPEVKESRLLARRRTNTKIASFVADRPLVLVIDDDPHVHELLMRMLRRQEFNVVTAFSGEEGLRLAKELKPAVITLDALMPEMSGWDVLGAIKTHPSLAEIPVIMISISDEIERGFALGASEFLTKPIERDRLLEVLQQLRQRQGPILVVEDDPNTSELLVRMLERNGWDTLEAPDGQAALDLLQEHKPALIITDLMMPVMDGFALIKHLSEDEALREIPVIVLTAMDLSNDELGYLNERIENVLQKGATPLAALEEQIKGLLEKVA